MNAMKSKENINEFAEQFACILYNQLINKEQNNDQRKTNNSSRPLGNGDGANEQEL